MLRRILSDTLGLVGRRRIVPKNRESAYAAVLSTNTLFVHVPKCAGKTVVKDIYGLELHDWFGHAPVVTYRSMFGPIGYSRLFKFAFVRDPVDRCRSGYAFARAGGFGLKHDKELQARIGGVEFEDFVLGELLRECAADEVVFKPQSNFLFFPDERLGVDKVYRFEALNQELPRLIERVRGTASSKISQVNQSLSDELPEVDEKVRRRIREIYAEDYQRLFPGPDRH